MPNRAWGSIPSRSKHVHLSKASICTGWAPNFSFPLPVSSFRRIVVIAPQSFTHFPAVGWLPSVIAYVHTLSIISACFVLGKRGKEKGRNEEGKMRPGRLMRQRSRNGPAKSGEHSGRGLGSFRGLCGSADQIGEYFRGWRVFFF